MLILALNYTFLGHNRLKMGFSKVSVLKKGLLMQDVVFKLRIYPNKCCPKIFCKFLPVEHVIITSFELDGVIQGPSSTVYFQML